MAAPPLQHGLRREPAQEADRGIAVAREDPVALLERVHEARVDRLVAAVDRVGADPALTVVHDRPLVVGAQQDERPVDREERLVVETLDAAVGLTVDPDRARQTLLDHRQTLHL